MDKMYSKSMANSPSGNDRYARKMGISTKGDLGHAGNVQSINAMPSCEMPKMLQKRSKGYSSKAWDYKY